MASQRFDNAHFGQMGCTVRDVSWHPREPTLCVCDAVTVLTVAASAPAGTAAATAITARSSCIAGPALVELFALRLYSSALYTNGAHDAKSAGLAGERLRSAVSRLLLVARRLEIVRLQRDVRPEDATCSLGERMRHEHEAAQSCHPPAKRDDQNGANGRHDIARAGQLDDHVEDGGEELERQRGDGRAASSDCVGRRT